VSQTFIVALSQVDWHDVRARFQNLEKDLARLLEAEDIPSENMEFTRSLDMRYLGQEYFINVPLPQDLNLENMGEFDLKGRFDELYESAYGHKNLAEETELVNLRVEARGVLHSEGEGGGSMEESESAGAGEVDETEGEKRPVIFHGETVDTGFVKRSALSRGVRIKGPVIVEEESCTTVVPPDFSLSVDCHGNLIIEKEAHA
jgi:N-methylhydantoinase A